MAREYYQKLYERDEQLHQRHYVENRVSDTLQKLFKQRDQLISAYFTIKADVAFSTMPLPGYLVNKIEELDAAFEDFVAKTSSFESEIKRQLERQMNEAFLTYVRSNVRIGKYQSDNILQELIYECKHSLRNLVPRRNAQTDRRPSFSEVSKKKQWMEDNVKRIKYEFDLHNRYEDLIPSNNAFEQNVSNSVPSLPILSPVFRRRTTTNSQPPRSVRPARASLDFPTQEKGFLPRLFGNWNKTGGKFIASGTYGCVTTPPVRCVRDPKRTKNNTYKGTVGKLFDTQHDANEEASVARMINKLDPQGEWTLALVKECTVSNFTPEDEKHKCPLFDPKVDRPYPQLIYKNGGDDLNHIVKQALVEHWSMVKKRNMYVNMCKALGPIIRGLDKLANAMSYQHADIKPANMLFDGKKLYVVDFGLICATDKIFHRERLYMLRHHYLYYPPEFKIYALASSTTNMTKHYEDFMKNYSNLGIVLHDNLHQDYADLWNKLKAGSKTMTQNRLGELFDKNGIAMKVDVYSVGMTFLELHLKLVEKDNALTAKSFQLFKKMAVIDCFERLTWKGVWQEYKRMFQ
jgi:hypothetical protein